MICICIIHLWEILMYISFEPIGLFRKRETACSINCIFAWTRSLQEVGNTVFTKSDPQNIDKYYKTYAKWLFSLDIHYWRCRTSARFRIGWIATKDWLVWDSSGKRQGAFGVSLFYPNVHILLDTTTCIGRNDARKSSYNLYDKFYYRGWGSRSWFSA